MSDDPRDDPMHPWWDDRPHSDDPRDDEALIAMWSQTRWRGLSDTQMVHVFGMGRSAGRRSLLAEVTELQEALAHVLADCREWDGSPLVTARSIEHAKAALNDPRWPVGEVLP